MLSGLDRDLEPIKKGIANDFYPALFDLPKEEAAPFCRLLGLPTKFGGTRVPDPTTTKPHRYETLLDAKRVLVGSLCLDEEEFDVELYAVEGKEAK